MTHNLRWDDLQIVLAVAEQRSLSGAARIIGVNHATVLRRIEAVEGQIGMQLFDRPPGGYRLKPEAQELLSSLQAIAQTVGRVERSLMAARLGTGGSFRLTTTDSVANLLLPRHLERLRAHAPGRAGRASDLEQSARHDTAGCRDHAAPGPCAARGNAGRKSGPDGVFGLRQSGLPGREPLCPTRPNTAGSVSHLR